MNMIQFIEDVLDIKLLDYQKILIKEMEKHPEYKFRIPRSRPLPRWYSYEKQNSFTNKE